MECENGKYYVYRHVRLDKNEPFYIGIGTKRDCDFKTTKKEYERANVKKGRNSTWFNIVRKTEYLVDILIESDDLDFIKRKEIEFIAIHGRRDLKAGSLVNRNEGGCGMTGVKVVISEKVRARSRETMLELKKKLMFPSAGIPIIDYETGIFYGSMNELRLAHIDKFKVCDRLFRFKFVRGRYSERFKRLEKK